MICRRTIPALLVLFAALVAPPPRAAGAAPAPTALAYVWPVTPAGDVASGWVLAFGAGEDSMRAFLGRSLSQASLKERNLPRRIERYREMRDKYGKLRLKSITQSKPYELHAKLVDADAKTHEFVFKVQGVPPHRLESVSMLEQRRAGHGFGGFHH